MRGVLGEPIPTCEVLSGLVRALEDGQGPLDAVLAGTVRVGWVRPLLHWHPEVPAFPARVCVPRQVACARLALRSTGGSGVAMGKRDVLGEWVEPATADIPPAHAAVYEAWQDDTTQKVRAADVVGACLLRGGPFTNDRCRTAYATMLAALRVLGQPTGVSPGGLSKCLRRVVAASNCSDAEAAAFYEYLSDYGEQHGNPFDTLYGLDVAVWVRYNKALRKTLTTHFDPLGGLVDLGVLKRALASTPYGSTCLDGVPNPIADVPFEGVSDPRPVEIHNTSMPTSAAYWAANVPVGVAVGMLNAAVGATEDAMSIRDADSATYPALLERRNAFLSFASQELPAALKKGRRSRNPVALLRTVVRMAGWSAASQGMNTHVQCRRCKRLMLAIDQHGAPYEPTDDAGWYCAHCDTPHKEFDRTSLKDAAGQMEAGFASEMRAKMLSLIYEREESVLSHTSRGRAINYAAIVGDEGVIDGDGKYVSPVTSPLLSSHAGRRYPPVRTLSANELEMFSDETVSPGLTLTPLTSGVSPGYQLLSPEKPRNPFSRRKDRDRDEVAVKSPPKEKKKEAMTLLKCGHCSRCMLSIDEHGEPLPHAAAVPLVCPGCGVESTDWAPHNFYDYVHEFDAAVREERRRRPVPPGGARARNTPTPDRFKFTRGGTPLDGPDDNCGTPSPSRPPPLLMCGECHRPQLRIDQRGEPLPLHGGSAGDSLPLFCPGCGVQHGNWVPCPLPPSALSSDGVGGAFAA